MSKRMVLFTLLAGITLLGSVAKGGLVSFSSPETVSTWSPSGAVVTQGIGSLGPVGVTMSAEAYSGFTITATATNESDITWTGYILSLDPQGDTAFVEGTAGSTKFDTVLYPDAWTIEFRAPEVVSPNQVVTLQFDLSIPEDGPHTFTLSQNPVPEPASMILLGFSAALLAHKRPKGN